MNTPTGPQKDWESFWDEELKRYIAKEPDNVKWPMIHFNWHKISGTWVPIVRGWVHIDENMIWWPHG